MPVPTITDIQGWLQRNKWVFWAPRTAGPSWVAIKILGGLSVTVALIGIITQNPAVALAAAAVFFFYSLRAYELLEARWRRESLDHKLDFVALPPEVKSNNEGTLVRSKFQIVNNADFDIYYVIDDDDFSINGVRGEQVVPVPVVQVLPAKKTASLAVAAIPSTQPPAANVINAKLTIRYGRRKDKLEMRWFLVAEIFLPHCELRQGWGLKRNDYEWIASS